jgi:hypothetical protein
MAGMSGSRSELVVEKKMLWSVSYPSYDRPGFPANQTSARTVGDMAWQTEKVVILTEVNRDLRDPVLSLGGLSTCMASGTRRGKVVDLPFSVEGLADHVTSLDLSANAMPNLPQKVSAFRLLVTLDLSRNRIETLPGGVLGSLPGLTHLSLSGNILKSCSGLEGCEALQALDLGCNFIRLGAAEHLPPLPSLTSLSLRNNWIEGLAPASLPPGLVKLALDGNRLASGEAFAAAVHALPLLQELSVADNSLRGAVVLGSDRGDGVLARLRSLSLSGNRIKSVRLMGLRSLDRLDLAGNILSDIDGILGCKALKVLSIANNRLDAVPLSLHTMSLQVLDLQGNRLKHMRILLDFTIDQAIKFLRHMDLDILHFVPPRAPASVDSTRGCADHLATAIEALTDHEALPKTLLAAERAKSPTSQSAAPPLVHAPQRVAAVAASQSVPAKLPLTRKKEAPAKKIAIKAGTAAKPRIVTSAGPVQRIVHARKQL